jgi:hypothetical protein
VTRNEIKNWWRIRRGRPALNPSDRELRRMMRRFERGAGRNVQDRLDRLVRDAAEYDLPLPFIPTEVVDGFIVHGQP